LSVRVRALSIHADYRCRSSGACCRSGWEIPVEPAAEERIHEGMSHGRLRPALAWSRPARGLPQRARVLLRVLPSGECVFLEHGTPRLCALQRQLGAAAMPSACRQFPRIATLTPTGVSLTLSHYCPTAATLLFRDDVALAVASDPPAFPASWPYDGLDARDAFPPLLRPGVLTSWAAHARLEEHAVAVLGREDLSVGQALTQLAAGAEALRAWTVASGPFDDLVTRVMGTPAPPPEPGFPLAAALADWERVAAVVPPGHPLPKSPRQAVEAVGSARAQAAVEEGCAAARRAVGNWLAAKAFASWLALQGEGLRTTMLGVRVAHSVLCAEAARAVAEAGGEPLDAERLKQAIRRADLLLVHLADAEALARELSRCEAVAGRVLASTLRPSR
jgi:Fe-S-cluster containining protein